MTNKEKLCEYCEQPAWLHTVTEKIHCDEAYIKAQAIPENTADAPKNTRQNSLRDFIISEVSMKGSAWIADKLLEAEKQYQVAVSQGEKFRQQGLAWEAVAIRKEKENLELRGKLERAKEALKISRGGLHEFRLMMAGTHGDWSRDIEITEAKIRAVSQAISYITQDTANG